MRERKKEEWIECSNSPAEPASSWKEEVETTPSFNPDKDLCFLQHSAIMREKYDRGDFLWALFRTEAGWFLNGRRLFAARMTAAFAG